MVISVGVLLPCDTLLFMEGTPNFLPFLCKSEVRISYRKNMVRNDIHYMFLSLSQ